MIVPDKYGHCVKCHKNMLIEAVIDGRLQKRFTPEYSETEFMLDDGSKMRVAICENCKKGLSSIDNDYIMKCVIEGWREEVEGFNHWSREKKDNYLIKYGKKKILTRSEGLAKETLERVHKDFNEKLKEK